jgi:hypothetical protein
LKKSEAADNAIDLVPAISTPELTENASRSGAPAPSERMSLLRYSPAVVLLAILIADSNRHTDPDLWGHIHFGQEFIARGGLISHDPYSYSVHGYPWRDHEWLTEVILAAVYNAGGVIGLKLWKLLLTAITVLFMVDAEASTGAPPSIQLSVLLISSLGLILQTQFRPQMFTLACMSALLALLARGTYRKQRLEWLAIPLMVLWTNAHGGFIAGIIVLGLYTFFTAIANAALRKDFSETLRLGTVTLAATAATLLNPYGLGIWRVVIYALHNPYTRGIINDWQPLSRALLSQWHQSPGGVALYLSVVGLIAGFVISILMRPRIDDLPLAAIGAFMSIAAFQSVRNMALAVIAISGPLVRHLDLLTANHRSPMAARQFKHQWIIVAACILLIFKGGLFSTRLARNEAYPDGAVAFLRAHNMHGNLLGDFAWGQYLIWHLSPKDKVFIDGRNDTVYPAEVVREYLLFHFGMPKGNSLLDRYPHDFVLISTKSAAQRLMENRRDWKLIYRDRDSLLYARANSPAANIPGEPASGPASSGEGFP